MTPRRRGYSPRSLSPPRLRPPRYPFSRSLGARRASLLSRSPPTPVGSRPTGGVGRCRRGARSPSVLVRGSADVSPVPSPGAAEPGGGSDDDRRGPLDGRRRRRRRRWVPRQGARGFWSRPRGRSQRGRGAGSPRVGESSFDGLRLLTRPFPAPRPFSPLRVQSLWSTPWSLPRTPRTPRP